MKKKLSLILAIAIAASMLPGFMVSQAADFHNFSENYENSTDANVVANPAGAGNVLKLAADTIGTITTATHDAWQYGGKYHVLKFDFKLGAGFTYGQTYMGGADATALVFFDGVNGTLGYEKFSSWTPSSAGYKFTPYAGWTGDTTPQNATVTFNKNAWNTLTVVRDASTGAQSVYVSDANGNLLSAGRLAAGAVVKRNNNDTPYQYDLNDLLIQPQGGDMYIDNLEFKVTDNYPYLLNYANYEIYAENYEAASFGKIVTDEDEPETYGKVLELSTGQATGNLFNFGANMDFAREYGKWVKTSFDIRLNPGAVYGVTFNYSGWDHLVKITSEDTRISTDNARWNITNTTVIDNNSNLGWTHFDIYRNAETGEMVVAREGQLFGPYQGTETISSVPAAPYLIQNWYIDSMAGNTAAAYVDNVVVEAGNYTFDFPTAEARLSIDAPSRNFIVSANEEVEIDPATVTFKYNGAAFAANYAGTTADGALRFNPTTALTSGGSYTVTIENEEFAVKTASATYTETNTGINSILPSIDEDFEGEVGADIVQDNAEHGKVLSIANSVIGTPLKDTKQFGSVVGTDSEYVVSFDAKVDASAELILVYHGGNFAVVMKVSATDIMNKEWGSGNWLTAGTAIKPAVKGNFTNWNHFDVVRNVVTGEEDIYLNGVLVRKAQGQISRTVDATDPYGVNLTYFGASDSTEAGKAYVDNIVAKTQAAGTFAAANATNFYYGNVSVPFDKANQAYAKSVTFNYVNNTGSDITGKMIIAGYDAQGKLICIATGDATLVAGAHTNASVACNDPGYFDGTRVKSYAVFFWDGINTMKPIVEAAR